MIEQTRFLGAVFLCSEFKLENIYSGVNFSGKNFCGNFHLRELIFYGSLEKPQKSQKSQKLEPAKISCHTVRALLAKTGKEILIRVFLQSWRQMKAY